MGMFLVGFFKCFKNNDPIGFFYDFCNYSSWDFFNFPIENLSHFPVVFSNQVFF